MRLWPRSLAIGRRHRRGFVAALLIINQFAVASGLPLPASAAAMNSTVKKDLSKPFPCMNRPCGCLNADQCWHSCCCFTMREKLAWAEANGVEPPAFVREAAAREALADSSTPPNDHCVSCEDKYCCCCCKSQSSHDEKQNCCNKNCEKHSSVSAVLSASKKPTNEPVRQPGGKSIILLMALGCQGQSSFSILAQALPFTRRAMAPFEPLPVGSVSLCTGLFTSRSEPPSVPPPERFTAVSLTCSVIEHR
jgi:hypothetical protein